MALPPETTEHPEALEDGLAIARTGAWGHRKALGQLSGVLDALFEDAENEDVVARVDRMFYDIAVDGEVRLFLRWFWGDDEAGVVAVIALKAGRPVLMSVGAVAVPGVTPLDKDEVERRAVERAIARVIDL